MSVAVILGKQHTTEVIEIEFWKLKKYVIYKKERVSKCKIYKLFIDLKK